MVKIYKIHPSIGIARVGNSPTQFFIGPEIPGVPPMEIVNGQERPLQKYKDKHGLIKRQAARFRVFEYEQNEEGVISSGREITADEATIEWQVHLVNRKAASENLNQGVPRDQLIIDPGVRSICGQQQTVKFHTGKFLGVNVYLGELQTDASGRLVVLGGRGKSASPNGKEITGLFSDGWYDDVSDGPVTAKITFPGQRPRQVDNSAWVIVGPPDFAPDIQGIVTLYDVVNQAAFTSGWYFPPTPPSFKSDIFPILNRAVSLRWVNHWETWNDALPTDWKKLSDLQDPTAPEMREKIFEFITFPPLNGVQLTEVQKLILQHWKEGNFIDDWTPDSSNVTLTPENLDRAALESCIGSSFAPGIEAGFLITSPQIYSGYLRLSQQILLPGSLTQGMSLPWQADFSACGDNWWPSQRPNTVQLAPDYGPPKELWDAGVADGNSMVQNFSKLGFVVPKQNSVGEVVFVEQERDPNFPRSGETPKSKAPKY